MNHDYIESHDIVRRYAGNRLSADENERFEAHYLGCAECQDQVEEFDIMRYGLAQIAAESVADIRSARKPQPSRPATRLAIAAVLAGLLVLPLWVLVQDNVPAQSPGNVPVLPVTQLRGIDPDPQAVLQTPADTPFLLMLELTWPEHPAYDVRILDAGGTVLWSGEGLQPNYLDSLAVNIPAGFLAPGVYHAEVFVQAPDGERAIGDFPFRLLPRGNNSAGE